MQSQARLSQSQLCIAQFYIQPMWLRRPFRGTTKDRRLVRIATLLIIESGQSVRSIIRVELDRSAQFQFSFGPMANAFECSAFGVMQEGVFRKDTSCLFQFIQCFDIAIQYNENSGSIEIIVEPFRSAPVSIGGRRTIKLC